MSDKIKNPNVAEPTNKTSIINKRNVILALPISLLAYSAYKIPKLTDHKPNEFLKAGGLAVGGLGLAFVVAVGSAMDGGNKKSQLISTLGVGAGVAGFSYLALRSLFNQNIVKSNSYALGLGLAGLALIYLNDKGFLGNKNKNTNNVKGGQPIPSGEIQQMPIKNVNQIQELIAPTVNSQYYYKNTPILPKYINNLVKEAFEKKQNVDILFVDSDGLTVRGYVNVTANQIYTDDPYFHKIVLIKGTDKQYTMYKYDINGKYISSEYRDYTFAF